VHCWGAEEAAGSGIGREGGLKRMSRGGGPVGGYPVGLCMCTRMTVLFWAALRCVF